MLKKDGTVFGLGDTTSRSLLSAPSSYKDVLTLKHSTTNDLTTLTQLTTPTGKTIADISAGKLHSALLDTNGDVYGNRYCCRQHFELVVSRLQLHTGYYD